MSIRFEDIVVRDGNVWVPPPGDPDGPLIDCGPIPPLPPPSEIDRLAEQLIRGIADRLHTSIARAFVN